MFCFAPAPGAPNDYAFVVIVGISLDLWDLADHRGEHIRQSARYTDRPDSSIRYVGVNACEYVCDHLDIAMGELGAGKMNPTTLSVPKPGVTWRRVYRYHRSREGTLVKALSALEANLTLNPVPEFNFAMALGFYKWPNDDTGELVNTEIGALVRGLKYYKSNPAARTKAGTELVDRLDFLIQAHPVLQRADRIVVVPSTESKVSEWLGSRLSTASGIPWLRATETSGSTTTVKNGGGATKAYWCPDDVADEAVIVLDDAYQSGGSLRKVGAAATHAGAAEVFGLVCARNLRSS